MSRMSAKVIFCGRSIVTVPWQVSDNVLQNITQPWSIKNVNDWNHRWKSDKKIGTTALGSAKDIKGLAFSLQPKSNVCPINACGRHLTLRLRRALALPVYAVALILDFASAALGCPRRAGRRRRLARIALHDFVPGDRKLLTARPTRTHQRPFAPERPST
jgi:hypothetical protein